MVPAAESLFLSPADAAMGLRELPVHSLQQQQQLQLLVHHSLNWWFEPRSLSCVWTSLLETGGFLTCQFFWHTHGIVMYCLSFLALNVCALLMHV
jgi:hypothetical protein